MYKTTHISLPRSTERVFNFLLFLYPEQYKKRFGEEMRIVFSDMYEEILAKNGRVDFGFLFKQFSDITKGVVEQHSDLIRKQGVRKYFHLSNYNIIGGILLLPFLALLGFDFLGRLAQGDFYHYNRAWYAAITQSVLYKEPFILQIILIFAPFLAVLLNIIPALASLQTMKKPTIGKMLFMNPLAFLIIGIGLFCLLIVYGHDFVPCMVHGIFNGGLFHFPQLLSFCGKA
jgi:hypothetical protein